LGSLEALKHECRQHANKLFIAACDVCDDAAQVDVFQAHYKHWGVLDFALINAGIGEKGCC
jgi:NADP-dependent 3-hydroxy acid dehydrogenase YdfG